MGPFCISISLSFTFSVENFWQWLQSTPVLTNAKAACRPRSLVIVDIVASIINNQLWCFVSIPTSPKNSRQIHSLGKNNQLLLTFSSQQEVLISDASFRVWSLVLLLYFKWNDWILSKREHFLCSLLYANWGSGALRLQPCELLYL